MSDIKNNINLQNDPFKQLFKARPSSLKYMIL